MTSSLDQPRVALSQAPAGVANGHHPSPAPAARPRRGRMLSLAQQSQLMQYLPGLYHDDVLMNQILLVFESVLMPLERMVDTLPAYTEPEMTPEAFLPWLAGWVGLSLDRNWPLDRQRALVADAAEIYRWRGTRRGLSLHIAAYAGVTPIIQEGVDGFVPGAACHMGVTTRLLPGGADPNLFVVTVPVDDPTYVDPQVLRTIIEEDKPAHATYRLRLVRSSTAAVNGRH